MIFFQLVKHRIVEWLTGQSMENHNIPCAGQAAKYQIYINFELCGVIFEMPNYFHSAEILKSVRSV